METIPMSDKQHPDDDQQEVKPKIIVDEDWKAQVEREKEAMRQQSSNTSPDPASDPASAPGPRPPEASFSLLVSTLATQAMAAMGLLADPETGKPMVERSLAKHFIDLLAMLEEKTSGNLTTEEQNHLQEGLHQLRMIYVATANQQPEEPPANPASTSSPIIQLP